MRPEQWYVMLSESERVAIVGNYANSFRYGLTVAYCLLSNEARAAVFAAFNKRNS